MLPQLFEGDERYQGVSAREVVNAQLVDLNRALMWIDSMQLQGDSADAAKLRLIRKHLCQAMLDNNAINVKLNQSE